MVKSENVEKAKLKIEKDEDYVDLTGTTEKSFDVINTGSIILNKVIGCGGIPKGRISEFFGPASSGKTTLATSVAIQAQKMGGTVLYLDFENAFDPTYAKNIGLDLDPNKFALYQPSYFEKAAGLIDRCLAKYKLVKKTGEKKLIPENERGLWIGKGIGIGVPSLIIIDSVAAMMPRKEYEGDFDSTTEIGLLPRLLSRYLRKLVNELKDSSTALILINQERTNIKMGPFAAAGPDYETTGGKAVKFYASLRMRLQLYKKEKAKVINPATGREEELPIQNVVRAVSIKNKVGTPYRSGEFVIRYGEGVDNLRSVLDIAISTGVISKGGAWFTYESLSSPENNFKLQGIEKIRDHILKNNPKLVIELQDRIEEHLIKDAKIRTASEFEEEGGDEIEYITEEYDVD